MIASLSNPRVSIKLLKSCLWPEFIKTVPEVKINRESTSNELSVFSSDKGRIKRMFYSREEILKNPGFFASKFFVSSSFAQNCKIVERPTEVWINVKNEVIEKIDAQSTFKIRIISPMGNVEPLKCFANPLQEKFICVFEPLMPGLYCVEVTICGMCHVVGSPHLIFITRNFSYPSPFLRISPNWNLIENINSIPKSKRKLWGLTYSKKHKRLYVADRKHSQILVFDGNRKMKYSFGRKGLKIGELLRPCGLAYDGANDQLLIADKNNQRIQVFDHRGKFLNVFENPSNKEKLKYPWGVAVTVDGSRVAVSEAGSRRVFLFKNSGVLDHIFKLSKDPEDYPKNEEKGASGISFDISGKLLYVSNREQMNIWMIDVERKRTFLLNKEKSLVSPLGISIDDSDNIIVADPKNSSITFLNKRGFLKAQIHKSIKLKLSNPLNVVALDYGVLAIVQRNGNIIIY